MTKMCSKFFFVCFLFFAVDAGMLYAAPTPDTIELVPQKTLSFGKIAKNPDGTLNIIVDENGNEVSNAADAEFIVPGSIFSNGDINIKGSNRAPDTINITFQSCGIISGIKVKKFTAKYGGVSWIVPGEGPGVQSGLPAPGKKGTNLEYGATLVVRKNAASGPPVLPCYMILVNYDCGTECGSPADVGINREADVQVIDALQLIPVAQMNFAKITRPSFASVVRLKPNGNINVVSGDSVIIDSLAEAGKIRIKAEPGETMAVGATFLSGDAGLSLSNFVGAYDSSGPVSIDFPTNFTAASSTKNLRIGADLNIDPSISAGSKMLIYSVEVGYQ